MKYLLLLIMSTAVAVYAGEGSVSLNYENLDFSHSKKKDEGRRAGVKLYYHKDRNAYTMLFENTKTKTFRPPLSKDLHVDKYFVRYERLIGQKQTISLRYATIDDNLMKQTDGGKIYGMGYRYSNMQIVQYLSDYKHFNVYQSDLGYTFRKSFSESKIALTLMGKYIWLQDRKSNNFSKNADRDYFSLGTKLHVDYHSYHFGVGAFFGKRIFAVMNDGFRVQHHAMEFNRTYMYGAGKSFDWGNMKLRYVHQEATEIPIHNKNVKVDNLILQVTYKF